MKNFNHIINLLLLWFMPLVTLSQSGSTISSKVQSLPVQKLLNYSSAVTTFSAIQKKITILDFFGTWCVPCLKALPHLTALQQKFREDISIVLVSNETEEKLQKFINARPGFTFPLIVDETNSWNVFFQPPSLPYTVILDKSGNIIAITEAAAITEEAISRWLVNPAPLNKNGMQASDKNASSYNVNNIQMSSNHTVQLSQEFIYAAKTGDAIQEISAKLTKLPVDNLTTDLKDDNQKKAFWINLYNGYTQLSLKQHPEQYKNRGHFFGSKGLTVSGEHFSPDEVEHGILRRSKIKWSLGHLSKIFPSNRERGLRVARLDYRIHFALNCGAKSCPPIAFYTPELLNQQLDVATRAYLTGEAEYDSAENKVHLPALMGWFRADFGGKKGMLTLVKNLGIVPADAHPKISFKKYDWTLALNNYKQ